MPRLASIKARRGTLAEWAAAETGGAVLAAGELGYITDTRDHVVGDGTTKVASLPRVGSGTYAAKAGASYTGTHDFSAASVAGISGTASGVPTVVNVKDSPFSAKGDGVDIYSAVMTSGSASLSFTAAGADAGRAFTAQDVGKAVYVQGAGAAGALLSTTISGYVSATQVTLAATAVTAVSGATATYGTDDSAAINAAVTAAKANGGAGVVFFPAGLYLMGSVLTSLDQTVTNMVLRGGQTARNMFFASAYGNNGRTELRYMGGGSTAFISARATEAVAIEGLIVRYMSPAFTGHLIDPSFSGRQSFNFTVRDALLSGFTTAGRNAASLVNCDYAVEYVFDNCSFENSAVGLVGRASGPYSNAVFLTHCHFAGLTTTVRNPYAHWTFVSCTFEPATMLQVGPASPIVTTVDALPCSGLTFIGCGWWDGNAGTWIDVRGAGVTIIGGYWEPQGGTAETLVRVTTTSGLPNFDGLTIRGLRAQAANNGVSSSSLVAWSKAQPTDTITNIDVAGNSLGSVAGASAAPVDGLGALVGRVSYVAPQSDSTLKVHGNAGSALTLTRDAAQKLTLNAATCVLTLPSVGATNRVAVDVYLAQDATGSRLVSWPAAVLWPAATAPTLTTIASRMDVVRLETLDGGVTWIGRLMAASVPSANAPGAPTGLTATPGSGQVVLSWTAPASSGGSAITDYVVQYRTTAGPGAWTTFADGTSTTTEATVTGLTNATGYDFQVAAVNAVGQGSYSSAVSGTPTAGAGFNPLSGITWTAAYWASDPAWSAPSSGSGVSSWRDGSGNSRTLTQATSGKQPLYLATDASMNSLPVVSFDGVDDQLISAAFSQAQGFTVVAVVSGFTGDTNGKRLLSSVGGPDSVQILAVTASYQMYAAAGLTGFNAGPTPSSTKQLLSVYFSGASSALNQNGTSYTASATPGAAGITSGISVGARNAGDLPSQVKIAFLGVYAGDVRSDANWTAFKAWVTSTYGITTA